MYNKYISSLLIDLLFLTKFEIHKPNAKFQNKLFKCVELI